MTAKSIEIIRECPHELLQAVFVRGHFGPKHPRAAEVLDTVAAYLARKAEERGVKGWVRPELEFGIRTWAAYTYHMSEAGEYVRSGFLFWRPDAKNRFTMTEVRILATK